MSVTGWKYPGTTANVDRGGTAWSNTDYAKTDDTNYASIVVADKLSSDYLVCKNYGFSSSDIPVGVTINGIEFIICKYSNLSSVVGDGYVYATKNGTDNIGSNFASASYWPTTSPSEVTYGGATALLGTTWTQSELVATTFGIKLSTSADAFTAYVDYIKVRVYYTEGGGGDLSIHQSECIGALGHLN